MKIIKCDRCGKDICSEPNYFDRVYLNQIVVSTYKITRIDCGKEQEIDLCPDCLNDLAEFLTKKDEKEEEEPPPDVIIAKNLQGAATDGINVIRDAWNNIYEEKTCKNCSNAGTIFSFMCEFCNPETHSHFHFKKKKE